MSDDEGISPIQNVPDRQDEAGNNIGISMKQARDAIRERGESERAKLNGPIDFQGERVASMDADATAATEPIANAWIEMMAEKYPLDRVPVEELTANDPRFGADLQAAQEQYRVLREGSRRAYAQREGEKFQRLCPQAVGKDGKVDDQFRMDALMYLQRAKKLSKEQALAAYNHGALGKATEQAKLFRESNAWGRDMRELQSLNAKRNLHDSLTLREAVRRETLMKRLAKF
jgi:hypothetical protein